MAGHGGNHYINDHCRCDECTTAHAARQKAARERRHLRVLADPSVVEHGRPSTYSNWKCRCEPCTDAHRVERQRQVARDKERAGE